MRTLLSEETTRSEETNNLISNSYSRFHSKSFLEPSASSSPQRYDKHSSGQSLQIRRDDLSPVSRFREENSSYTNSKNLYGQATATTTAAAAKNKYSTSNLLKQSLSKRAEPLLPTGKSHKAPYYYEPGESPSAAYTSQRYQTIPTTTSTPNSKDRQPQPVSTNSKTYDISKYSSSRLFASADIEPSNSTYLSSSYAKTNYAAPDSRSSLYNSPSTKFSGQTGAAYEGNRYSGNTSFRVEYSDNEDDKVF